MQKTGSVSFATHDAQQGQQALEDIDSVHVQGQGGSDVIGFASINDLFDIVEHESAEDAYRQYRNHQHTCA